jgi:hypothetical protein
MFNDSPFSVFQDPSISNTDLTNSAKGHSIVAASQDGWALSRMASLDFITKRSAQGVSTFSDNFSMKQLFKNCFEALDHILKYYTQIKNVQMVDSSFCIVSSPTIFGFLWNSANGMQFHVWGDRSVCQEMKEIFGKEDTRVEMNWWFKTVEGHQDERTLDFVTNQKTHDAYYPFLRGGVKKYFEEYMASSAPVLVLKGEPGTGKTSFIKTFIKEYALNTMFTFDQSIMESDYFYCDFLTDSKYKLLVIEDADLLLASREKHDNRTMGKLLNISEGLIKLEGKKIIFSTNIQQIGRLDEALIRPGRCFDVLSFGRLTKEQALEACKAAEMPPVEEDRDYALFEIFNRGQHVYYSHRKIGF